jgi:cytochrome c553
MLRRLIAWTGVGVVLVVAGALLFAWSGLYNVAASKGHFAVTAWLLQLAMRSSVQTHAGDVAPPPLDDPRLIAIGAGHYASGCEPCHGSPGRPRNPIALQMLPPPPDLRERLDWTDAELFWIIRNGIKYAGMPAWVAPERKDEVWAIVAFLRRLPALGPEDYRRLAMGDDRRPAADAGAESAFFEAPTDAPLAACVRCHGLDGEGRANGAFPRLSIQSPAYLEAALRAYASGKRASGIMQPVAAVLDDGARAALAAHYGRARPSTAAPQDASAADAGRRIALEGEPQAGVVACASCHGASRAADVPALAGQYEAFIIDQLRLFREGVRGGEKAAVMKAVADRMSEAQIAAVASWYASLAEAAPRSAVRAPLRGDER